MFDQRITETFVELADTLVLGFDGIDFLHTLPSVVCSSSVKCRPAPPVDKHLISKLASSVHGGRGGKPANRRAERKTNCHPW